MDARPVTGTTRHDVARAHVAGGPWLDVAEAAAYLRVTPRWMRQRVADRSVRFYKVGRFVRFRREDLDALAVAVGTPGESR